MISNSPFSIVLVLLAIVALTNSQISQATCLTPSQDNSFCLECRGNYHLYEGLCYIDIIGCQEYIYGNICRKCSSGFILVNNECCDRVCMSKAFIVLTNSISSQQNLEETKRKAQLQGYQKSVSTLAQTSIKQGQTYDILSSKSQYFGSMYRYQISLNIQSKKYIAILDYDTDTKQQPNLVDLSIYGQPEKTSVSLNQDNIHKNAIYENGYKYIYMKYGLELYELEFYRMAAIDYGRSTELSFVFVSDVKAVLITIVVTDSLTYTLWKEEKNNVEEVKSYIDGRKKIQNISKQYNFQQVLKQFLTEKKVNQSDTQIQSVTAVSKEQYQFIIYLKVLRIRYSVSGSYNAKTNTTTLSKVEQIIHPKLIEMTEPVKPQTKIITKDSIPSSPEAKQAFDYLLKVRPSFRQTQVNNIQIDKSDGIKKTSIMENKNGTDYRIVILKDQKTGEMQLVDESQVTSTTPQAMIIQKNSDGTTSITTNQIDENQPEIKTVLSALRQQGIDTTTQTIQSIQTTDGPGSVDYTVVLGDQNGNPTKQVTITQDKTTNQTSVIDLITIDSQPSYLQTIPNQVTSISPSQFYKPEIQNIITQIQNSKAVKTPITAGNVKKIDVFNSTLADKYELTVENNAGQEVKITAIQDNHDQSVNVLSVVPTAAKPLATVDANQVTSTRSVDEFGVTQVFTNNQPQLADNQNVKVALTSIDAQIPQLSDYTVKSCLTQTYPQNEIQTLILTNSTHDAQVTGNIDLKTLRYVVINYEELPSQSDYPVLSQKTIPASLYPTVVKDDKTLKDTEAILTDKYKMFKGKVPVSTTIVLLGPIIKITYKYRISEKKFIIVIFYDIKNKTNSKIQEVSPVADNIVPVNVQQTNVNGQTVTTTDSILELQKINPNTNNVIAALLKQYPILTKNTVSTIKLTEGPVSDVFDVTYQDSDSQLQTTVTLVSTKDGNVVVQDVKSNNNGIDNILSNLQTTPQTISISQFNSENIQQIVKTIKESNTQVTNVTSVTSQSSPTYVTYTVGIVSNGKPMDVTIIQKNNQQQIVDVQQPHPQAVTQPQQTTSTSVDTNGNTITLTNNTQYIKSSQVITQSLSSIKTTHKNFTDYLPQSVQTTVYGNITQVTMILNGPNLSDTPIQSTVYYDNVKNIPQVVSVEPITVSPDQQDTKPQLQTNIIPQLAIPSAIKSDTGLKTIINEIKTNPSLANSVATSVETQTISQKITQYTVTMTSQNINTQVIYTYNQNGVTTPISVNTVPKTTPYYYSQTDLPTGQTISSNSVQKVTEKYPDFTSVVKFANSYLTTPNWDDIQTIQVSPSQQSNTYTITVPSTDNTQAQTIVVTSNLETKTYSLVDLSVTSTTTTYPQAPLSTHVDLTSNKDLINSYKDAIQSSGLPSLTNVQSVPQVRTEKGDFYQKVFLTVLNPQNEKYFVTLLVKDGQKPIIVDTQAELQPVEQQSGVDVTQIDQNGNTITETTRQSTIIKSSPIQTTIQQIVGDNKQLIDYDVTYAKTIDLGTVWQLILIFQKLNNTPVQTISYYNEVNKTAQILSIKSITSDQKTPQPQVSTYTLPTAAIPDAVKSDSGLNSVLTNIQSQPQWVNAVPISTQVQPISNTTTQYTVLLNVQGQNTQTVYTYNTVQKTVTTITTSSVSSIITPSFTKQQTTPSGQNILTTNNIPSVNQQYPEFNTVLNFASTIISNLAASNVSQVQVSPQTTGNTYTLTVPHGPNQDILTINYDLATSLPTIASFTSVPVITTSPVVSYTSVPLTFDIIKQQLNFVQSINNPLLTKPINVVSMQTTKTSLYEQTILEVETKDSPSNIYVKYINTPGSTTPQIADVTSAPKPSPQQISVKTAQSWQNISTSTTDANGNLITVTNSQQQIKNSPVIQGVITSINQAYPNYQNHNVKIGKITHMAAVQQVVLTLSGDSLGQNVQATAYYNTDTKTSNIIAVQPTTDIVKIPNGQNPSHLTYTTADIADLAKTDSGFNTILTQIQANPNYTLAVPISAQVQTISGNISQYNVILNTKGVKQQVIYTYDESSLKSTPIVTTTLPKQTPQIVYTDTVINEQTVTISNNYDQIKAEYPQTQVVVDSLMKSNPSITYPNIESFVVIPESQTTTVTIITKNVQASSYSINKYVTGHDSVPSKIQEQKIPIIDVSKPKPIQFVPTTSDEVLAIPQISKLLTTVVNTDKTKPINASRINSAVISSNTNIQIYNIQAVDANNRNVTVEIQYNPVTSTAILSDVSQNNQAKPVTTVTEVKDITNRQIVFTTNPQTITEAKEFKRITDQITKSHPTQTTLTDTPVIQTTERYQRSTLKTIVFSKNQTTIQGSYLIDSRTNSIVELDYKVLPISINTQASQEFPITVDSVVYPASTIQSVLSSNPAAIAVTKVVEKVDISLAGIVPIYLQIKTYSIINTITIIYDMPTSNSRVLALYNTKTGDAKVIDYSKMPKSVQPVRTVESTNSLGQITVFTTNTTQVTTVTQFTTVYSVATNLVPNIQGKPIRGVQTVSKENGKQYRIVTVDNGVINSVILHYDTSSNKTTLISSTETPLATQLEYLISKPVKDSIQKLDIQTLQTPDITTIANAINADPSLNIPGSTVVSGTVTSNNLGQTYNFILKTPNNSNVAVKVTVDKNTKKPIINNVQTVPPTPPKPAIKTVMRVTQLGFIETTTNNVTEIITSITTIRIIRKIIKAKPKLTNAIPISAKTITYGNITEVTIVLSDQQEGITQVTSTLNQNTGDIQVVDSKPLTVDVSVPLGSITPQTSLQTIPASAIPIAAKKLPEINQILSSVKSSSPDSTVTSLQVEDFGNVKKYVAVATTPKKAGQVYVIFFNKKTNQLNNVQTVPAPADQTPSTVTQSLSDQGESVTSSSSVIGITAVVPQVTQAVAALTTKYNPNLSTIQSVQSKGTTTKEITITTKESSYTIIVSGTSATVVDVQQPTVTSPIFISSTPKPTGSTQTSTQVQPSDQKQIITLINNSPNLPPSFSGVSIQSIEVTSNVYTTTYQATVKDKNNQQANVTLVQNTGQPLKIVNLHTNDIPKNISQAASTTQITVSSITGQTTTVTTDQPTIKSDSTVRTVTQTITTNMPQLSTYTTASTQTITYKDSKEITVVFASPSKTPVQVTTLYNTTSNTAQVVSSKNLTETQPTTDTTQVPVTTIQTIPGPAIPFAAKRIPEINQIISSVQSAANSTNPLSSLTVQDLGNTKKYSAQISTPNGTISYVFYFDKETQTLKPITSVSVPTNIAPVSYNQTSNKWGEIVTTTNNIPYISNVNPDISSVLSTIDSTYSKSLSSSAQSVVVTQQKDSTQYKLIVGDLAHPTQVTVMKVNGQYQVLGIQTVPQVSTPTTASISSDSLSIPILTDSPVVSDIQNFINTPKSITSGGTIKKITSTQTPFATTYTVTVSTPSNIDYQVTILSQPNVPMQITSQIPIKTPTPSTPTQESSTTKQVNPITGQKAQTTTATSIINSPQNQPIYDQIVKNIPSVAKLEPTAVKTTTYGDYVEKTVLYTLPDNSTVQSTILHNPTTGSTQVLGDSKQTASDQPINAPTSNIRVIPAIAISTAAKNIPAISKLVTTIQGGNKASQIQTISVEDYETTTKYVAVVPTATNKQSIVYLYDKPTQKLTQIDSSTIPLQVTPYIYQQTTSQYGLKTIIASNITQAAEKIPEVTPSITYIQTKYPSVTPSSINLVKTIQYTKSVQTSVVTSTNQSITITIVVTYDRPTQKVTQLTSFSSTDLPNTPSSINDTTASAPTTNTLSTTSPQVNNLVKLIQQSPDVPVDNIKNVMNAFSTSTSFGSQTITLEALAADDTKIRVVSNYNPSSDLATITNYEVLQAPSAPSDTVTQFKVDTLTGAKSTTTNDKTVLASSQITSALLSELKNTKPSLSTQTLSSSTTIEYPDNVQVISTFTNQENDIQTQVVSFYDKSKMSINVVNIQPSTQAPTTVTTGTTPSPTIPRQVYTSTEIPSASQSTPSISKTTEYIKKQLPVYASQNPSTVIIQTLSQVDLVSHIYETPTTKNQIVVMYDKTSGNSRIIESSPVPQNVQPFTYQEKKNGQGKTVLVSNNLTEVIQRVPKTEVLKSFIDDSKNKLNIDLGNVKTVQTVVNPSYNEYTLVVAQPQGPQQYSFILNTETNEVKQTNSQALPASSSINLPQVRPTTSISPDSVAPMITQLINNPSSNLTEVKSIVSITKTDLTHTDRYDIQYVNSDNQINKLIVQQQPNKNVPPVIVDERPVTPNFVAQTPQVISQTINNVTMTGEIVYSSPQIFDIDVNSQKINDYVKKNVPETENYTIETVRKSSYGKIDQYDILFKSPDKAPLQVSIANDKNNQNLLLLETKKITQPQKKNVLDSSSPTPASVEVSDIEKENIKVLSKLGLVKDLNQYIDIPLDEIGQNDQFVKASQAVKQSYSVLLKDSVIIKVLQKKSLESDSVKVFYKSKDQIYEASISMNPITKETKLTDFIKIGTQSTTKSQVNVYSDLCYGYQVISDISSDSNLNFLVDYLKKKYTSLVDASLSQAQIIVLENSNINYKLYFKKDTQTVKYIVYYEPDYKRVLEVKSTSFAIGNKYTYVPTDKQVSDPYFRKLDTYIRQNREIISSASVLHTETMEDNQNNYFRTVYNTNGKTYRSIASINKDNQNIYETGFNEVVQIPTEDSPTDIAEDDGNLQVTKLDAQDLGKNLYFTEAHRFIQSKYQTELNKAQLLGASSSTNLFTYTFTEFYIVDETIFKVSADYSPITQKAVIASELQIIDIQKGYYPARTDKKLTDIRNWLKQKNLDLSTAVMISSMSKPMLFGSAYKIIFKDMTKYYTYVVYYDSTTREMKILFENDSTDAPVDASSDAPTPQIEAKLKGFAKPSTKTVTA